MKVEEIKETLARIEREGPGSHNREHLMHLFLLAGTHYFLNNTNNQSPKLQLKNKE